jgi:putative zincin peptidase
VGWEQARDCSMSSLAAIFLGVLFVVPSVGGLAAAYAAIWGWRSLDAALAVNLWELPVLLLAIALHELIHGVTWAWLSGKGFGAIRYGFHLATLTPFAHSKEPLPVVPYAIGALMPGLVLGVLPCLVAMLLGWATLMLFGLAMTVAAGGDLLVVWLLRGTGRRSLVLDHPSRAGCWVLDDPVRG